MYLANDNIISNAVAVAHPGPYDLQALMSGQPFHHTLLVYQQVIILPCIW